MCKAHQEMSQKDFEIKKNEHSRGLQVENRIASIFERIFETFQVRCLKSFLQQLKGLLIVAHY